MGLKNILDALTAKDKKTSFVKLIRSTISDSLKEMQERLQEALQTAVRSVLLMSLTLVALIFILVGLSKYLSVTVPGLAGGLGYAVVGGGVLFLVLITYLLHKE
ncbi:MAG: hypothetical protein ACQESE_01845 [Nanobdellota archaeon]